MFEKITGCYKNIYYREGLKSRGLDKVFSVRSWMNWTLKVCDNTVNEQGGNFHSRNRKRHDRMFLGRREHESFEEQMSWKNEKFEIPDIEKC